MLINIYNRLRSLEFEECKLIRKVLASQEIDISCSFLNDTVISKTWLNASTNTSVESSV